MFVIILDVMLKLRQLPKLISKLLLHLRTLDLGTTVVKYRWFAADLDRLGAAVTQVPRAQQLEMWKTLNYHLEADGAAGCQNWARILLPLLNTLLVHCTLADHNVPSTLLPRIRDLAESSLARLQLVCSPLSSSEVIDLYYTASRALLELGRLLLTHRNLNLTGLQEFQNGLVSAVLKQPKSASPSSYKVLVHGLLTDKNQAVAIFDAVGGQLCRSPDVDPVLLLSSAPASLYGSIDMNFFRRAAAEDLENPLCAALLIHRLTFNIHNSLVSFNTSFLMLAPLVVSSHLWSSSELWYSLDSELGRVLQTLARQLQDWSPGLKSANVQTIATVAADFCRLSTLLPLEHLPRCLKLAATLLSLTLVYCFSSQSTVPAYLTPVLARCLETTDLFRYANAGNCIVRLLGADFDAEDTHNMLFSTVLPVTMTRFTKTLVEITAVYPDLEVHNSDTSAFRKMSFLVGCLEQLPRPILDSQVAAEKRDAASALATKICKSVNRLSKLGPHPASQENLRRAAVTLVKIYGKTKPDKIAKCVRRLLNSSREEDGDQVGCDLALYGELLALNEDSLGLPDNWKQQAWAQSLRQLDSPGAPRDAATALAQHILSAASLAELEPICAELDSHQPLAMAKLLLAVSRDIANEDCRRLVQARLDSLVTGLLTGQLGDEQLSDLVSAIVGCTTATVTSGVEVLALAALGRIRPLSNRTLALLVTFVNHRPNISTRHIPLVCALVRQHLHCIEKAEESEATAMVAHLQNLFGLMGRKREDWANVAPYLLADVLNSCLAVVSISPRVKQELVLASHSLLDMQVSQHSYEYLGARLPPATNEIFKVVLQNYKQHHKFTGKD